MNLLDTCTLLWLARGDPLPAPVMGRIADPDAPLLVSAVSAWEIGVKLRKGRLALPFPVEEWWNIAVRKYALGEVPIDPEIALRSTALPPLHADPADRILVATALHLGATLLTPDPLVRAYPGVRVEWE